MLKAVFFDIDGTLTSLENKPKKIPETTYEALRQLHKGGLKSLLPPEGT